MKHELDLEINGCRQKNVEKETVNTEHVGQKLYRSGDNVDPHVRDEVVRHVVFADPVGNGRKSAAHEIKDETIGHHWQNGKKMSRFKNEDDCRENGA